VAQAPDQIVLKRDRDLEGRDKELWIRRGLMALVAAVPVIALFNVFGQRPTSARETSPEASLKVYAPTRIRGGLLYEARFTIRAKQEVKQATLVLEPGWGDGLTINTLEPSPVSEGSRNGSFVFKLGHVPAGGRFDFFLQFQVNPTAVGHRGQDVVLFDGSRRVAAINRTLTIYP
jgi:hypothetical protein